MYAKSTHEPYNKPVLERFGTFRELTQLGPSGGSDVAGVLSLTCNPNTGDADFACGGGGGMS